MKKNVIWNFIGLSFNAFISLFLLVIIKRVNGMDISGIFSYSFSLCALFFVISMYYTRAYQLSNYNDTKTFRDFLIFRIIACLLSFVLLILFSIINQFDLFKLTIIILIMIFRTIEAISDCFYGRIQEAGKLYKVGISMFLKNFIGIIVFIIADIMSNNIILSLLSLSMASFIVFIVYDLYNYRNNKKVENINKNGFKIILKESTPIFLFTFMLIYMTGVQKYVLPYYLSNSMQTIFGILIMPSTMLSLIGNYLIMPFMNDLTDSIKKEKYADFIKLSNKILLYLFYIGLGLTFITWVVGIPILNLIYSIDLSEYKLDLIIIMFGSIVSAIAIMMSNILVIVAENKKQLIIYFICSILSTLISIILISKYAIRGASFAYLFSYLILLLLYSYLYYKKIIKMK